MSEIIYDMPAADYHAHPAISKSGLDRLAKSPAHYKYWQEHPQERTSAMIFGQAYHMSVLEAERFEQDVVVVDGNRNSNAVKEAVLEAEREGKIVLKGHEHETILQMREALFKSSKIRQLLTGAKEVSLFWTDTDTGVECRARLDCAMELGIITDLKSTENADMASFIKSVVNYNYYTQGAFYTDGFEAVTGESCKGFVLIPQEKTPPYLAAMYRLDDDAIRFGRKIYKEHLRTYAECLNTGNWPGYEDQILDIWLPSYVTGRN